MSRKKIATAPVAKARRPVRLARKRLIAASTTDHIRPTSSPGISALVSPQTAAPPCTLAIDPPYSSSSGIHIITRQAPVNARYLASG